MVKRKTTIRRCIYYHIIIYYLYSLKLINNFKTRPCIWHQLELDGRRGRPFICYAGQHLYIRTKEGNNLTRWRPINYTLQLNKKKNNNILLITIIGFDQYLSTSYLAQAICFHLCDYDNMFTMLYAIWRTLPAFTYYCIATVTITNFAYLVNIQFFI